MTTTNEELVENFLKKIKQYLPEWIKSDHEKSDEILLEIESHIWASAQEIAGSEDPDPDSIKQAIHKLGDPKEIGNSYKNRGTPKYFISEELWPFYVKAIGFITVTVFIIIFFLQIVSVELNNLFEAFITGLNLSYTIILTFIAVITAIFVGLSYEGYLPEDLDSSYTKKESTEEPGMKYYKPGDFLFNGTLGVFMGLFVILRPLIVLNLIRVILNWILELLNQYSLVISSEIVTLSGGLQILITLLGVTTLTAGIVNLLRIRHKEVRYQFNMSTLFLIVNITDFMLANYILTNLQLISEVFPLPNDVLIIIASLGILGSFIQMLSTGIQTFKLYGAWEASKNVFIH